MVIMPRIEARVPQEHEEYMRKFGEKRNWENSDTIRYFIKKGIEQAQLHGIKEKCESQYDLLLKKFEYNYRKYLENKQKGKKTNMKRHRRRCLKIREQILVLQYVLDKKEKILNEIVHTQFIIAGFTAGECSPIDLGLNSRYKELEDMDRKDLEKKRVEREIRETQ